MTPKIDYGLLGDAVRHYTSIGYEYVEVPWVAEEMFIRATLPEWASCMAVGQRAASASLEPMYAGGDCLVGSAEQGFISLALKPGRYVGVTPCFRIEDRQDLFYQDMFMKVELFDNRPNAECENLLGNARDFFLANLAESKRWLLRQATIGDTVDWMLGEVEIGSYGKRTHEDFGTWCYGTGLALPRFSVARAVAGVV